MTDVLVSLSKLPPRAFTVLLSDPCLVIGLHRGVPGYTPLRRKESAEAAREMADRLNAGAVTPAQLEAMEIGSMFGWHVPGADPDNL